MLGIEMPRFQPEPWRKEWRFPEEVISNFGFLESKYGFRVAKEEVTFVRYENQRMFVNVWHGRGSYCVGVEIGFLSNKGEGEDWYSLIEILDCLGAQGLPGYAATDKEQVSKRVQQVAKLVEQHASCVLEGVPDIFAQLEECRRKSSRNYELNRMKGEAEIAWQEKDYEKVERLYRSMFKNELTASEVAKLRYAEKKLKSS